MTTPSLFRQTRPPPLETLPPQSRSIAPGSLHAISWNVNRSARFLGIFYGLMQALDFPDVVCLQEVGKWPTEYDEVLARIGHKLTVLKLRKNQDGGVEVYGGLAIVYNTQKVSAVDFCPTIQDAGGVEHCAVHAVCKGDRAKVVIPVANLYYPPQMATALVIAAGGTRVPRAERNKRGAKKKDTGPDGFHGISDGNDAVAQDGVGDEGLDGVQDDDNKVLRNKVLKDYSTALTGVMKQYLDLGVRVLVGDVNASGLSWGPTAEQLAACHNPNSNTTAKGPACAAINALARRVEHAATLAEEGEGPPSAAGDKEKKTKLLSGHSIRPCDALASNGTLATRGVHIEWFCDNNGCLIGNTR